MEANDYQVGGRHYVKHYQHWDMVCDVKMPYLLACATKYVSRWKEKNGVQDLRKSIHYIQKADELGIYMPKIPLIERLFAWLCGREKPVFTRLSLMFEFAAQFGDDEYDAIMNIYYGEYERAKEIITHMIYQEEFDESEPNSAYTNQD